MPINGNQLRSIGVNSDQWRKLLNDRRIDPRIIIIVNRRFRVDGCGPFSGVLLRFLFDVSGELSMSPRMMISGAAAGYR